MRGESAWYQSSLTLPVTLPLPQPVALPVAVTLPVALPLALCDLLEQRAEQIDLLVICDGDSLSQFGLDLSLGFVRGRGLEFGLGLGRL